VKSIPAISS
jgi:hypothetical protein